LLTEGVPTGAPSVCVSTLEDVTEPLAPTVGWGVLHLFCKLPDAATSGIAPRLDTEAVVQAVKDAQSDEVQVVTVAILGHKADLGIMALGPDLWRLRRLQADLQAAGLAVVDSYVSLTEVSEYATGVPEEMKQKRLYPQLPPEGMSAFCFYPMSKRRSDDESANWFMLPFEERKEMMYGHGAAGRKFAGRIVQVITGSTGIDDWEWGVTLFGVHPDDLKECVYTMRFDEGSARFAEFGRFLTGMVAPVEDILAQIAPGA
jgi:peroxiredoxin